MVSSAQFVSPKPAALPPAAPPALPGSGTGPNGGPSFMQFMNEQPAFVTPPHNEPVPGAPDDTAPAPAATAQNSASTTTTAAAARRKEGISTAPKAATPANARPPEAAGADASKGTSPAEALSAEPADALAQTQDDTDAAIVDTPLQASSLQEFTQLIGLSLPTAPTAPAVDDALPADPALAASTLSAAARAPRAGRAGPAGDDAATDASARPTLSNDKDPGTSDRRLSDTAVRPADTMRAKAVELAADKAAAPQRSASTDALQATSARATAEAPAPRPLGAADGAVPPSFAAVLAQSLPSPTASGDAAPAPVSGQLHAALHSPAFAPELAASVSLLAADGVQHAELQLNPAEMGPVAVQIVVDGAQAQVSFHAVHAETRQALEQSLPDLAAALQGQGLTLSGGGVFQQSPHDAQGGNADSRSSSGEAGGRTSRRAGGAIAGPATGAPTVSVRRAAGLLDTFA